QQGEINQLKQDLSNQVQELKNQHNQQQGEINQLKQDLSNQVQNLQNQHNQQQGEINQLKQDLSNQVQELKNQHNQQQGEINQLKQDLSNQVQNLQNQHNQQQKLIEQLEGEKNKLNEQVQELKTDLLQYRKQSLEVLLSYKTSELIKIDQDITAKNQEATQTINKAEQLKQDAQSLLKLAQRPDFINNGQSPQEVDNKVKEITELADNVIDSQKSLKQTLTNKQAQVKKWIKDIEVMRKNFRTINNAEDLQKIETDYNQIKVDDIEMQPDSSDSSLAIIQKKIDEIKINKVQDNWRQISDIFGVSSFYQQNSSEYQPISDKPSDKSPIETTENKTSQEQNNKSSEAASESINDQQSDTKDQTPTEIKPDQKQNNKSNEAAIFEIFGLKNPNKKNLN
uniref:hypothetical protein n=1 Tax=Calothrix sp. FACHB-168 TaxID=2692780 RepID=UPI0016861DDA